MIFFILKVVIIIMAMNNIKPDDSENISNDFELVGRTIYRKVS